MKKIILLLLVTHLSFSQNCKFQRNEIDSFSKEKVILTNPRAIMSELAQSVVVQFLYEKTPFILFDFEFQRNVDFVVTAEKNVLLLLGNEQVISLNIGKDVFPKYSAGLGISRGGTSTYKMQVPVTLEDLISIKTIGVKKIRFETTERYREFDVDNKSKSDKVYQIIDCFLSELEKK